MSFIIRYYNYYTKNKTKLLLQKKKKKESENIISCIQQEVEVEKNINIWLVVLNNIQDPFDERGHAGILDGLHVELGRGDADLEPPV